MIVDGYIHTEEIPTNHIDNSSMWGIQVLSLGMSQREETSSGNYYPMLFHV